MGLVAGIASAGAGLFGSIIGADGQKQQAAATSAADNYQAQVAENNAAIARQNATAQIESGEIGAENSGLQTRAKIGTLKASQGANGVEVNSGSAAEVRAGTEQTGLLDALTIRSNNARQAYGYEVQGTSDEAQAGLDRQSAANATTAGNISSDGTLLSGASTVARSFSPFYNATGTSGLGGLNLGIGG